MTPAEQLRAAFIKSRGLNITDTPIPQIPVQSVPIRPTDPPVRTDIIRSPGGPATDPTAPPHQLYPAGPPATLPPEPPAQVVPPVNPSAPYAKPPKEFPTEAAPAVPFNPVRDPGPTGVSLNSNPVAPGWAGTVGLPGTPTEKEAAAFNQGQNMSELVKGLETMKKGIQNKSTATDLNTLTPMSAQPNVPSQVSGELMAQILQNARRPRGLTLTGR